MVPDAPAGIPRSVGPEPVPLSGPHTAHLPDMPAVGGSERMALLGAVGSEQAQLHQLRGRSEHLGANALGNSVESRQRGKRRLAAMAAIALSGVGLARRGTWILRDIDLVVEDAERVCLLGPSGAGKSALLRLVAGLGRPTTGSITVGGRPPEPRSEEHTSELQSRENLVCRLLLEKKNKQSL